MELTRIARDILNISQHMKTVYYNDVDYDDGDLYMFDQTWASTALGFGGMGGSAMTTATTYVFVPAKLETAFVFFDGYFAYQCDINDRFREDIRKHNMASVQQSGRYKSDS